MLQLADNELRLSNQALLLAFNYFDHYLSMIEVRKTQLQLVSTGANQPPQFAHMREVEILTRIQSWLSRSLYVGGVQDLRKRVPRGESIGATGADP
eukprot:COSAG01_NODE_1224_length_11142_cov_72.842615_5_plen_96_part_00